MSDATAEGIVLSVVVPVFDEEAVTPLFVERLRPVLDGLGETYEVLAVDDGSRDATPVLLQRERRTWPQLRVVRLRANAGHQAALSAGLARARGAWTATLDADLQDPPELLAEMLRRALEDDVDVVYAVRDDRSTDSAFKRWTARAYYALMRRLAGGRVRSDAGDFRLMSRATIDAVNALPEHHRVLRLVVPALGFPEAEVGYRARGAGGRPVEVPAVTDDQADRRQPDRLLDRAAAARHLVRPRRRGGHVRAARLRAGGLPHRPHGARLDLDLRRGGRGRRRAAALPRACSASTSAGSTPRCRAGPRTSSPTTRSRRHGAS